jgi:hypothetical protein
MKAHIFEQACPLYQEGAITPIFEGDMPPEKKNPKSGANIGTIAGELLIPSMFFHCPQKLLCFSLSIGGVLVHLIIHIVDDMPFPLEQHLSHRSNNN